MSDQQVASEINEMVHSRNLKPSCIVEYLRRAFVGGGYYPDLRVTFDTNIRGRTYKLNELNNRKDDKFLMPTDKIIMEIKFNDTIPEWIIKMLIDNDCEAESMSKYCLALETDPELLQHKMKYGR
jgi:hypothetical protein